MDDADRAELDHLRQRAYGTNADIHDDAAALARLQELEGEDDDHPDRSIPDGPAADPDDIAESTVDVSRDHLPSQRPRPARNARVVTGGLVILTAAVSAIVTVLVINLDPTAVGQLRADPNRPWIESSAVEWVSGERVRYEDFMGLAVMSGTAAYDPNTTCLVVDAAPAEMRGTTQGCAARGLTPVVDLIVGPNSPEDILASFAQDTTLRFTLEGDAVTVHVGSPPADD